MMRAVFMSAAALLLFAACNSGERAVSMKASRYENRSETDGVRFVPIDIYLESEAAIAAYQVELSITSGDADIVGVEGAALPGFEKAPHYDPKALRGDRIIIGAFSTEHTVPPGRHRVATVHMRESGKFPVTYRLIPMVAADARGESIPARGVVSGRNGE